MPSPPSMEQVQRDFGARLRAFVRERVRPDEIEDLLQDIWLRVHQGLDGLETPAALRAWLYRIAGNAVHDHYRRRPPSPRPLQEEPQAPPSRETDTAAVLLAAIRGMDEPYRTAIELHYRHQLGPAELAQALGIPPATAKTHLARGLAALRRHPTLRRLFWEE